MISPKCWLIVLIVLGLQAPPVAAGNGREKFVGPRPDSSPSDSGIFADDTFDIQVVWRRPLGSGYSGFSISGERAITLFSDGHSDLLVALEAASGQEIWRHVVEPTYRGHSGSDDGPLGSPTVSGDLIYAVSRHGQMLAVDLDSGALRWSFDLEKDFRAPTPIYGFSTSPLIHEGVLIVQTGGPGGRSITGLDPAHGKILWSVESDAVDHQSPLLATFAGERQVLAVGRHDIVGLRPKTGAVLWRYRHRADPEVWAQPVLVGESGLFISYYFEDGTFFKVSGEQGRARLDETWRSDLLKRSYVVPIYHDGYLYGFRGNLLFCVDPTTGKEIWASREPGNGGTILVDGHLITLSPRGDLVVASVSAEGYEERSRTETLNRGSLTPPSFSNGRLFVRNLQEAACLTISNEPKSSD